MDAFLQNEIQCCSHTSEVKASIVKLGEERIICNDMNINLLYYTCTAKHLKDYLYPFQCFRNIENEITTKGTQKKAKTL